MRTVTWTDPSQKKNSFVFMQFSATMLPSNLVFFHNYAQSLELLGKSGISVFKFYILVLILTYQIFN